MIHYIKIEAHMRARHRAIERLLGKGLFQGKQRMTYMKQRTCVRASVFATAPWNASQASPAPSSLRSASTAGAPNAQRTTALARTWHQDPSQHSVATYPECRITLRCTHSRDIVTHHIIQPGTCRILVSALPYSNIMLPYETQIQHRILSAGNIKQVQLGADRFSHPFWRGQRSGVFAAHKYLYARRTERGFPCPPLRGGQRPVL